MLSHIYHTRACANPTQTRQYAEADAFWCFMELISEFRDHFCAQLDNARTGIRATLKRLMALLRYHDEALWRHIEVVHKVGGVFGVWDRCGGKLQGKCARG